MSKTDAAHTAALYQQWLKVLANHHFCRSATDVDHQLAALLWLGVLNAHKNQARLFLARDNFNGIRDNLGGTFEECLCIGGLPQGVSPDDTHVIWGEPLQTFSKQGQTGQAALDSLLTEHIIAIQAIGQMHALFQAP